MRRIIGYARNGLGGLLALNALLLCGLALVTFGPSVTATQDFRARGRYHGVSATAPGVDAGVIFIADEINQQLIAFTYNPNTKKLAGVGGRDLSQDVQRYGGRN